MLYDFHFIFSVHAAMTHGFAGTINKTVCVELQDNDLDALGKAPGRFTISK